LDKVVLTKEQAGALESAKRTQRDNGYDLSEISAWKAKEELFAGDEEPLNHISLETLNIALYLGYEVEPSPEDKLAKIYKEAQFFYKKHIANSSGSYHAGQLEGIQIALDLFNIRVKGVNC
jgi:hypothetical protein